MTEKKKPQFKNIMNFESWVQYGIDQKWVSPVYCDTHDGGYDYWADDVREEYEKGGDPCVFVLQVLQD